MAPAACFLSSIARCDGFGVTIVVYCSVFMVESAFARDASLSSRLSFCLSESAIAGLPVVRRLAAGVESL